VSLWTTHAYFLTADREGQGNLATAVPFASLILPTPESGQSGGEFLTEVKPFRRPFR
jgi:hypothetical protein